MNYDFTFGVSVSMDEQIAEIINICDKLDAEEETTIFEFGEKGDLVLHIYKDCDYNRERDKDYSNLVTIQTAQNGEWVDDTEDTYVSDGSLYRELERIWNYRDFGTL